MARSIVAALSLAFALLFSLPSAQALVVAASGTTVDPASYPGWTQGDPGWDNISTSGANYVYLGNQWVLSARHVGVNNVTFNSGTFAPTAGQDFIIHNPPPSLAGGLSLTTETDLRLIHIDGDPGLPALTIASQSPPTSGINGSQVMFVSNGPQRNPTETTWQVNTSTNPWTWTESPGGNFHGYKTGVGGKAWGTNRLASPSDPNYQGVFKNTLSTTTAVMPFKTADQVTRDVISMLTSFDQQGQNGATLQETQGVSGDSGGAVFYKNGSQWQLAGIVNSTLIYSGQVTLYGVYGDATTFSDLSYYNKPYQGSICDVMKSCGNYSVIGDVNLDGVVSGNGTGPAQTDDVTAFVAGWRYDNNAGAGDYVSWTHGDMNHDGKTNVDDFLMLRGVLNGPISAAALNSLFGGHSPSDGTGNAVPEPFTGSLAAAAAGLLALGARSPRHLHPHRHF